MVKIICVSSQISELNKKNQLEILYHFNLFAFPLNLKKSISDKTQPVSDEIFCLSQVEIHISYILVIDNHDNS